MKNPFFLIVVLLGFLATSAVAEVPQLMNYQGRLTDDAGNPLDTTVSIVFTIYDDSTGGVPLWSEVHPNVTTTEGRFSVKFGTMAPIDDVVFRNAKRWLGIQVGADPEISPRTQFISVPYAFRVSTVDGTTGGIISGDVSVMGKVTIGPGHTNIGTYAFVAGENNSASGARSAVGGGLDNSTTGDYSAVGGGRANSAQGLYSVIPGGMANTVTAPATASMAFGDGVYINNALRVIFFDGMTSGRLGLNRDYFDGGINHPIHVGTDGSNGNGAHLTAGGAWTNGSSRTFKDRFESLNGRVLLDKITSMPVQAWCYRGGGERHIGPVAEDFVAAFDVGTINEYGIRDNLYLSNSDVAGVALAGVKELILKNQDLEAEIVELKELVRQLLEQKK